MEAFTYKGIAEGKYVEGEIEALNQEEASHKLKEQKVIITNLIRTKKKKGEKKAKRKGGGFSFGKPKVKVESPLKLKLWGYQRVISEICCLSVPWPIAPISWVIEEVDELTLTGNEKLILSYP